MTHLNHLDPQSVHQDPIRILHVVGGMVHGGIETWLMHCLRHTDRDRFSMDFLVHTDDPCAYDAEILALGSRIIPCLAPHKPWKYRQTFLSRLEEFGSYNIIHSHLHHFSGFTLRLARQAGIPIRIAHSHNDISTAPFLQLHRHLYISTMTRWIRQLATQGLACSQSAAAALYGRKWQQDERWQVLYYGLDLQPFKTPIDHVAMRAELGIPIDAYVIGHVGRFVDQKNHRFLLDIMMEVTNRSSDTYLVLVGEGPLKSELKQYVQDQSLQNRVLFLGGRNDVPQVMRGIMNHFLFPSLFEGLGLVLIEAQAAGLPCLFSSSIPEEVEVIPSLLQRIALAEPPSAWAERLLAQRQRMSHFKTSESVGVIENSPFNIKLAVKQLENIYSRAIVSPMAFNSIDNTHESDSCS